MVNKYSSFLPIRACLFDIDGLLLNTEDLYTKCTNIILHRYGRPSLPWSIKAQLQGRPAGAASEIFHTWAKLPISPSEYVTELAKVQQEHFPTAAPLPGVERLLDDLQKAGVHLALATSSHEANFKLKSSHLPNIFRYFDAYRSVLGDDKRVKRGKPAPDIYILALQLVNETLAPGEREILPEECLVFEDSIPGVEAGRRAGMRVIWCPHPELAEEFTGKEEEVLAGRADTEGEDEGRGELGDGWAEYLVSLVDFPYERYGIKIGG
jgi:pseudouridine 5'-phosphatase